MGKVLMPEVAAGATHAVVSKWLVEEGSEVSVGQVIVELETDKAVVEYSAEEAGKLSKIIAGDGVEVEVGAPIAIIGEDAMAEEATPNSAAPEKSKPEPTPPAPIATPIAEEERKEKSAAPESVEVDPARRFISPVARKMAIDSGLDLGQVVGTGPDGRIVRRDVESAIKSQPAAAEPAPAQQSTSSALASQDYSSAYSSRPHSSMRRAIARRLTESKTTIPHFYLTADCDVAELLELRKKLNEVSQVKISVNDMVIRAVAAAFMDVPEANVVWTQDQMLIYESADIAIAVATDGGLLTPVLRGVEKRSLSNIAASVRDLAERARSGKLRQEELEGGSFAITNLGMYGTEQFNAIINPPQSGILAVGAASERPVVRDGQLAVGNIMTVTLSADHRAVDGALAAQWLKAFQFRIENPLTMLV
ncbi:MAG: dihydrolipoamide acetyltransferase family protein [Halieaceae bacterium]